MAIKTFAERQKAQYIYDTYFDDNSEHCLDFNLFDNLSFYSEMDSEKILDGLNEMKNSLFEEMKKFDEDKMKDLN